MRWFFLFSMISAFGFCLGSCAAKGEKPIHLDFNDKAPAFTVQNVSENTLTIGDVGEKKAQLLVFNRSLNCPFTKRHLASLKENYERFQSLNVEVIIIARDDEAKLKAFWDAKDYPFQAIYDENEKLGDAYGQEWKLSKLGLMPALFLISQEGRILFSHYAADMADIPSNETLFAILKTL